MTCSQQIGDRMPSGVTLVGKPSVNVAGLSLDDLKMHFSKQCVLVEAHRFGGHIKPWNLS
jgi:hypothetical protein